MLEEIQYRLKQLHARILRLYFSVKQALSHGSGVSGEERSPALIVSLTSYRPRFPTLHLCLEALLSQSLKPDRLVLWLAKDEDEPPDRVRKLVGRGLEIRRCPDLCSYKKLVPTLAEFPEAVIVTADDDTFYPRDWLEEIYRVHREHPGEIVCYRGWNIEFSGSEVLYDFLSLKEYSSEEASFHLMATGKDGVLYPPGSLHADASREDLFMELSPTADDIWFKAMAMRKRTRCRKVRSRHRDFPIIRGTQDEALWRANNFQGQNEVQMRRVFEKYGLDEVLSL